MNENFNKDLSGRLNELKNIGTYKSERIITTPQAGVISVADGVEVINLCANNYLGLSNHPELVETAKDALERYGYGMSSVRFICGTQEEHITLEQKLSQFLDMDDTILYSSCFDANTGLFETLLGPEDAIISDALNHASIIDGIRLCKAKRFRYANNNLDDLEIKLEEASDCRYKLIATDGVFSMDGYLANLEGICNLAEEHNAMVMVDDSHAVGFVGARGKGTHEHCNVMGRIDILTGTLGKALGGASGGYVSASKEIVGWLRQRSRPYLFSNTLAPVIAQVTLHVLDMLQRDSSHRDALWRNTRLFRDQMTEAGFKILPGEHPIVPIMLRDPKLAQEFAEKLLERGIFVTAFSFPVVPEGLDRIRTQMSAAHSVAQLEQAIETFRNVGKKLGII